MADPAGTLQIVGNLLTSVLRPLELALDDAESFKGFFYRLGWNATAMPPAYQSLGALISTAVDKLDSLGDSPSAGDIADLLGKAVAAFKGVTAIAIAPPGVDAGAFLAEISERLFELLLTDFLSSECPTVYGTLLGMNIIKRQTIPAAAGRPTFVRTIFDWNALLTPVTNPGALPAQVFGWGTPTVDTAKIINVLSRIADGLNFPVTVGVADEEVVYGYLSSPDVRPLPATKQLDFNFFTVPIAGQDTDAGFTIRPLPASGGSSSGIAIEPRIPNQFPLNLQLADDIALRLRAGTNLPDLFGVTIRPGDVSIQFPFKPGTPPPTAGIGIGFDFTPTTPVIVFGEAQATRLEFQSASADFSGDFRAAGLEFTISTTLTGLALTIAGGDTDSFINSILGSASVTMTLPLDIEWSSLSGLTFKGSGAFEVALPTHLSLGPIAISNIVVRLAVPIDAQPKIALEVGANIDGSLGPLTVAIDQAGIGVYVTLAKGNVGPVDLSVGFLPPKGVGLSVDAGVVGGGGYLYIDMQRGQYAGALQLTFADFLQLTAIGLIETKLPDGSDGFSLLIIITADFGPGIQLGFGFTLNAVGGLLGVNRGMQFTALMEAVRTNAIAGVLFPQNVVANAQRIISDLNTLFPPQTGTFLIGPMAKLGWGEPTLVSISLGIIIEIPPGDIAILGILRMALPADEAAILVLQVNFAGAIEVDKQRIYFYAALFDSHLLFITIDGSMGLLVAWGDNANFVVSIGGFHPQFNPPPLPFPTPQRINISLINESFARIQADGYFAVTSNTVQFGTHASYFFGFSALNVQGASGFDALIQFSPFHFIVSFSTSFSVNVFGVGCFGIDITLSVDGPTPFHASGTASISFFFFSVGIHIDFTWGDTENTTLPPVAVMPLLVAELGKPSNWRALLPPGSNLLVSLRKLDAAEAAMLLHPVGTLQVSQRLAPLDIVIDTFGNQQPTDANDFTLDVSSSILTKSRTLTDLFAPAQFENLSDAQKLSQPAYVPLDCGIELAVGGTAYASGTAITRIVRYDITIIDTKLRRVFTRFYRFALPLFQILLNGASVTKSPLSAHIATQTHPYAGSVTMAPEGFAIALRSNNTVFAAEVTSFSSQLAANAYLKRAVANDPTLAGTLHVLPQFELAA